MVETRVETEILMDPLCCDWKVAKCSYLLNANLVSKDIRVPTRRQVVAEIIWPETAGKGIGERWQELDVFGGFGQLAGVSTHEGTYSFGIWR